MLTITVLENGNLSLVADNPEEIQEMLDDGKDYWSIMHELFEDYACNGSYTIFDASHGNPFVGLYGGPCIAEAMDCDDDGRYEIEGRFWYFNNYCTEMETELLAAGETVVYSYFDRGEAVA